MPEQKNQECNCGPLIRLQGEVKRLEQKNVSERELMDVQRKHDLEQAQEMGLILKECAKSMTAGAAAIEKVQASQRDQNIRLMEGHERFNEIEEEFRTHSSSKNGIHSEIKGTHKTLYLMLIGTWLFLASTFGPKFLNFIGM